MTFLNPLMLAALAAAAIPVILHLINLRKLRTIEFSSLTFLKELQKTTIRRLKLRQLLLLILRTLLILFLVLAFARPTYQGSFAEGMGPKARATAVILIDDSYSMTASDGSGEYLKQARESARNLLAILTDDDDIHVLPLSRAGRRGMDSVSTRSTVAGASSLLEDIRPTPVHQKLEDGLRLAAKILSASDNLVQEIFVISDFQTGLLNRKRENGDEFLFGPQARLFLIPIGSRSPSNLAIESLSISNTLIEARKPFSLDVAVANHSSSPVENHLVSIFLNGTRVAQKGISVEAGGIARTSFSVVPSSPGFQNITAELENDDLEFDNRRFLSLHLSETIRVLLAGESAGLRYVRLALETRQQSGSSLTLATTPPDRITSGMLEQADVMFLANPGALTSFQSDRVNAFVRNGGGLAIFPGAGAAPTELLRLLELPPFQGIQPGGAEDSFVEFDRAEMAHPLFDGMFTESGNDRSRVLESPRIRRFVRAIPTERSAVIIALTTGSPFLLEQRVDKGRVLLFTVAPTLEWSDFPLKGLFVPLIQRTVSSLSQEQIHQPTILAGETVRFSSLPDAQERLTIVTPRNIEGGIQPEPGRGLSFGKTDELGTYTLKNTAGALRTFSVNIDPDESRTVRATEESLETLFSSLGIPEGALTTIEEGSAVQASVLETRHGVELWKHFLIAALFLAITEMLLARTGRGELPGVQKPSPA
ncbi:MAG: BatA domain-containing protein [Bacteroidota bacterium]